MKPFVHSGIYSSQISDCCALQTWRSFSYDRMPPCFEMVFAQCSEFFHNSKLENLRPDTMYHYRILAANGTGFRYNLRFILKQEGRDLYSVT